MSVKKAVTVILYTLGLTLLIVLGIWQLNRGLQKASVISRVATESTGYQSLDKIPTDFTRLEYSTAHLAGAWLQDKVFLLDNRIHDNQPGYEVITPFRLTSGQLILINRGWMAKSQVNTLPFPTPNSVPQGTLYLPSKGFTLGNAMLTTSGWPRITLYLDLPALEAALQEPLSHLMLVLDADNASSLTRIWKPVVIDPERHYAYSAQWFGLAFVFVVFGFIWRKKL